MLRSAAPTIHRVRPPATNPDRETTPKPTPPAPAELESRAVAAVFPAGVRCSSTKAMTGHMLGAAGGCEAAFLWLALHPDYGNGRLPPHLWDGAADPVPSFSIVTTRANTFMESIHDRMPVVLDDRDLELWLDPEVQEPERVLPLVRPCPPVWLAAHEVSRAVNSVKNNRPGLLAAI